ncbi:hypothetical protein C7999DRAFT_29104 [Corynascus novoguineensis]|uniref:Uncharacterized protein n=1 Tax=Corynascus novoguineensis TaxID=1126955 RepID=A0AAN7HTC4_9PEZI|nr:hypothetical protein C7999DRAFT_29104 [Corynascus novoguineensis]
MSAAVAKPTGTPSTTLGSRKAKGGPLTSTPAATNKVKEVGDLLADMSAMASQIDTFALAAASEKDAKQRAERELEVERSRVKAHQQKDKTPRPTTGGSGRSAKNQKVLDALAELGVGIDGAESTVKKTKEQLGRELDEMRAKAEAAEVAGKKLEEELRTVKSNAEAIELSRKKLENELSAARAEVSKLTAKIKEDYENHIRSVEDHERKGQELEEELEAKDKLLDQVIEILGTYRARLDVYAKMQLGSR